MNWLGNKPKGSYHQDTEIRSAIDYLLEQNASLQSQLGIDSSEEEKSIIKSKTDNVMAQIKKIDPAFHDFINL